MQIVKSRRFDDELEAILDFIAHDNLSQALTFYHELILKIEGIVDFPKKYRRSKMSNDDDIREMVFTGYVVVYKIYNEKILVIGIFNQNLWKM
jgi:plasmid stabilization system protein ParE